MVAAGSNTNQNIDIDSLMALDENQTLALKYTQIFPANKDGIERVFRKLRSKWHPDRNGSAGAAKVFSFLMDMHSAAMQRIDIGVWGEQSVKTFETENSSFLVTFLHMESLDGMFDQYISKSWVVYHIPASNSDLVDIWVANLEEIQEKFNSSPLLKEDKHLYYSVGLSYKKYTLVDKSLLMVFSKSTESVPLDLVLKKHSLRPEDVAWMMTRLIRMTCLMERVGVPNLGISTRSVFINPRLHSATLFDGWEFGTKMPGKPVAAPAKVARMIDSDKRNVEQLFKVRHMISLIKSVGRTALNDLSGVRLLADKKICPPAMAKWLNSPCENSALKELDLWEKAKKDSFGEPKFVDLVLNEDLIYD